jgi:hypothetical protein
MLEPLVPRALVGKTVPMPDPEARERPLRRSFTAAYKRRIVEEANAAAEPGMVGAAPPRGPVQLPPRRIAVPAKWTHYHLDVRGQKS